MNLHKGGIMVRTQTDWTVNRIVAFIIGIVFLIIGILGLILHTTSGSIFGFQVDLVHNLVHLVTGILGIAAAYTGYSRLFNQVFGIIYLALGILGLFPGVYFGGRLLGIMHVNGADNLLHLIVGIVASAVGFFVNEPDTGTTTDRDSLARP
jgi:hypothetical protein